MNVPRDYARKLLLLSALGPILFTIATLATVVVWQERSDRDLRSLQREIATQMLEGQVAACERGNVIRRQRAEDNLEAMRTTRDLLGGAGLSADQRRSYRASLRRKEARALELREYPCGTLRLPPIIDTGGQ